MKHPGNSVVETSPPVSLRIPDLAARATTFYGFVAALTAAHVGLFAFADLRTALRIVADDASYYLQIAGNVASGRGFTFDGINPTNGFQPLWLLVLIAVHTVVKGTPETLFRASMIVSVGLLSLACLVVHRTLRSLVSPARALLAAVICAVTFFRWSSPGMESALLLLALAALFAYGWRARALASERAAGPLVFGLLAGLVLLARLDTIFFIAPVLALLAVRAFVRPDRGALKRLWWTLIGASILTVPYLVINWSFLGGFMPISGQLKSSFPHPMLRDLGSRALDLDRIALARAVLAIVYLAWYGLRRRAPDERGSAGAYLRGSVAVLALGVALHFVHEIVFMRWATSSWHFAAGVPLFAGVAAAISSPRVERLERRLTPPVQWLLIVASSVLCARSFISSIRRAGHEHADWHVAAYEAAVWARTNTSPDAVLAMKDAGTFGYFSQRRVVNLDGLVNNLELQRALRDRDLAGYLRRKNVGHLVQHAFVPNDRFLRWTADGDLLGQDYERVEMQYYSQKYRTFSDALTLRRERESYRSDPFTEEGCSTRLLIWSLDPG